jgi:hypothetical protein
MIPGALYCSLYSTQMVLWETNTGSRNFRPWIQTIPHTHRGSFRCINAIIHEPFVCVCVCVCEGARTRARARENLTVPHIYVKTAEEFSINSQRIKLIILLQHFILFRHITEHYMTIVFIWSSNSPGSPVAWAGRPFGILYSCSSRYNPDGKNIPHISSHLLHLQARIIWWVHAITMRYPNKIHNKSQPSIGRN